MASVGVIIVSSSDDICFLRKGILELLKFATDVVIAFGTRYWNGEPEDEEIIRDLAREFPRVKIVRYETDQQSIPGTEAVSDAMYNEALARWTALQSLSPSCTHVLVLDSDEIVDGEAFRRWWQHKGAVAGFNAVKFANYWYWRHPTYRARSYLEDSVVLIDRRFLTSDSIFHNGARTHTYDSCQGSKQRMVHGAEGEVMIHHFSWVRTEAQMLRKVTAWGHRDDFRGVDLPALVKKEFSGAFRGTDFLRGLRYEVVRDKYGLGSFYTV
jgi:hypothetical protein